MFLCLQVELQFPLSQNRLNFYKFLTCNTSTEHSRQCFNELWNETVLSSNFNSWFKVWYLIWTPKSSESQIKVCGEKKANKDFLGMQNVTQLLTQDVSIFISGWKKLIRTLQRKWAFYPDLLSSSILTITISLKLFLSLGVTEWRRI